MTHKKLIGVAATAAALGAAGIIGLSTVSAASTGTSLADKIATTFHLNKDDVQKVIDQDKSEHQAAREADYEKQLTQDVTDGKITAGQKDLILAKHKELEAKRDAARDSGQSMTDAERKTAMDAERTELKKWATDNNIPLKYLMPMGGPGGHGGPGGPRPADAPAPDAQ